MVEVTQNADGRDIIVNGTTKAPFREAMKGILPEKIRLRTDKIDFGTPQDEWFRNIEFQKLVSDILTSDSFRNRNIIKPEVTKVLYKRCLNKEINIAKEIWRWPH